MVGFGFKNQPTNQVYIGERSRHRHAEWQRRKPSIQPRGVALKLSDMLHNLPNQALVKVSCALFEDIPMWTKPVYEGAQPKERFREIDHLSCPRRVLRCARIEVGLY